jgi:low affinity Fe/Cu permease
MTAKLRVIARSGATKQSRNATGLWRIGITGPLFHFSDAWQLVINTATTIVTFLMVFLIQDTQNRDSAAVQLKLGELIRHQGKCVGLAPTFRTPQNAFA